MKYLLTASILALSIGAVNAADLSKGEASAQFRLKVAACKAEAKDSGVKTASAEFYSHMSGCLDRTTVAVNVVPAK